MYRKIIFLCLLMPGTIGALPYPVNDDESRAVKFLERARILYERSDYDSLPYYYREAGKYFKTRDMHERVAECMLGMVDYYRLNNLNSNAGRTLAEAESYIESQLGKNSESWADALYVRAKLSMVQNRLEESIKILGECRELQRSLGMSDKKMASVYNVLGAAYYTYGDLDSAEANYLRAYVTYMKVSGRPSVDKGNLLFNLGLVYRERNMMQKWLEYITRGVENNILIYGPEFPGLATYYNSISSYYIRTGRPDSAKLYLDRAESIYKSAYGDDYFDLSRIYINRARIYRYEGDYQASLDYYLQAILLMEGQEIMSRSLQNVVIVNISSLYESLGDFETAYQYLEKLLEAEGEVHPSRMAAYYSYLASILVKLGKHETAEVYFRKTFALRDKYFSPDHYGYVHDYMAYGAMMDSLDRIPEAGMYYRKALSICRHNYGDYHFRTSGIHRLLGDHFRQSGDLGLALDHYQKAIHALVPGYDVGEIYNNPDPEKVPDLLSYLRILKQKAMVLRSLADSLPKGREKNDYLYAAFNASYSSINAIELLHTSYIGDESKLYLSENERRTYENCIDIAYDCFELSSDPEYLQHAFTVAEKAKYATLRTVLRREEALELPGIPDSVRLLESQLKKQLSVYRELLVDAQNDTLPDQAMIQQYSGEIFRLKDRIAGLYRQLETHYPDYYELLYRQEVSDLSGLARNLGRDEKIIEYFMTGSELYIFEISRQEFRCSRDSIEGSLLYDLDLVQRYTSGLSERDTIQDKHQAFIEAASRLYERLVPSHDESFRDLVIIPEGMLSYFPFDILITDPVPEFSGLYNSLPFLIRSHTIRYGYSASLLNRPGHRKSGRLTRFAGFAPGYLAGQDETPEAGNRREILIDRQALNPLPGSIDEVCEIGDLLRGTAYIGEDASEDRFKALAAENQIIHLATHAFIDDMDPLKSVLVFSENPHGGEDGLLNVYEVYEMDLNAGLVVLSACNTGSGELKGGEGVMSLARAFFYAGVPSIVMTLWTVEDRKSYELMLSFYRQLLRGRSAGSSLRKAKLEFLENALPGDQHPRYWSGYFLVGNPEHLFIPAVYWQLPALAVLILIGLVGLSASRRYKRKKN